MTPSRSSRNNLPSLPQASSRWWWLIGLGLLLVAVFSTLVHWLTEYWWFSSVGFDDVFRRRLGWSVLCAIAAFVIYGLVLFANYWLALWFTRDRPFYAPRNNDWTPLIPGLTVYGGLGLIVLLAVGAAQQASGAWEPLLKFLNSTAFGTADPIFQRDVSFYVFRLPLYQGLQSQGLELLVWSLLMALGIYALRGEIRLERGWKYFLTGPVKTHLCILLSAIALLMALGFWLSRFALLYSASGVVFGAGFTDVHARLHAYSIMAVVTLVVALLLIISLWRQGFSLPLSTLGIYLAVWIIVSGLYPWLQQSLVVEPNELDKESPYIAHSLKFTRQAYALDSVQREDFVVKDNLDAAALANNAATLSNLRLWDYQTLLSTYQELQGLRLYYRFHDVDIDRYTVEGDYRQVMLAARELDYDRVAETARNWVNQRLKYTHGYGLTMSPVNQVSEEGLPNFFIKNIPPETTTDLEVTQPRIYYGEKTNHHIYTGTSTDEFDYPLGNDNATNAYEGKGGVPMGSFGRRLAYALDIGTLKPLVSGYFTGQTKIHYHRNIQERAQQIVPFLELDSDPYLALVEGRLLWIIDAYSHSDRYPYSEPLIASPNAAALLDIEPQLEDLLLKDTNYIRDAAKVVIDAYDGSLSVYTVDERDPVLTAYRKIFPGLFTPLAAAPEALRSHFRYPLNLFQIQSQIYRTFHMENTEVFYNQEDLWQIPRQLGRDGQLELMQPYYIIMRLPNAEGEEFLQILPFTPSGKDNMVAWMAARCDQAHYGQLVLYEFPKQALVYGPRQIESRIDQNTEISQQLTLWNQQGSNVNRGNLLAIPVDQSLLYFEPVYLQAEQGALPELKRVIVAYKNAIVMRQSLSEALVAIFGEGASPQASPGENLAEPLPTPASSPPSDTVEAAIEAYQQGQSALQRGDWAAYGQSQRRLGDLLEQLNNASQASTPAPEQSSEQIEQSQPSAP